MEGIKKEITKDKEILEEDVRELEIKFEKLSLELRLKKENLEQLEGYIDLL